MTKQDALTIPQRLAGAGVEKLTLVGGEPMLCPWLEEILPIAKDVDLTTCLVTNGSLLNVEFLQKNACHLDWIGLSLDASNDVLHSQLGRGLINDIKSGVSRHLEYLERIMPIIREHDLNLKLNTVVTSLNQHDDMLPLISRWKPKRWKAFQVLPVEGQNDLEFRSLELSNEVFERWCTHHSKVRSVGIDFVPESVAMMRGSYAMLDCLGRFYDNIGAGYRFGRSILDVNVLEAWSDISFNESRFRDRGGYYDWKFSEAYSEIETPQFNYGSSFTGFEYPGVSI